MSVVVALVGLALLATAASAAPPKQYTLSFAGSDAAVAGRTVTFRATFTNGADQQQQLGSANLTPPAGFVLVSASVAGPATATVRSGKVELRNLSLQPGAPSLTVTVVATVPCAGGGSTWSVVAKQANNFNGTGNDLTLAPGSSLATPVSGSCALRFVTPPAAAEVNAVITGTALDPSGPSVTVEVVDGGGARVTSWGQSVVLTRSPLSSGLGAVSGGSAPVAAGLATFSALKINAPGWYRLTATSGPLTTAEPSAEFRIYPDGTPCLEDQECTATATTGQSKVTVTGLPNGNPDAGLLTLTFGAGLALDCDGYTELTDGTAVFEVTNERTKTATLEVDKREMAALPNNGASFLNLCFGSEEPFPTKGGGTATAFGTFDWDGDGVATTVYRGLLPDCGVVTTRCVSKRQKDGSGDGIIQALLPAGDPGMRG